MMRVRRVIANVDCTFDTSDYPEFHINTKREVRERNAAALLDLCRKHRGGGPDSQVRSRRSNCLES